jgi:protein FrlC
VNRRRWESDRKNDTQHQLQDAIDNALRLGAPYLSLCPGMTLFGQDLDEGLDYTEGKNPALLIEPAHEAESTLILTVADGLRMIDEIGSERLGILLDTGHANVNGEDLAAAVRSLKDVPLHIHIDDNHGDSDAHLVPGEGTIDFQPFVQALKEIDYQGFVSGELGFGYTLDPDTAVVETYDVLSDLFA